MHSKPGALPRPNTASIDRSYSCKTAAQEDCFVTDELARHDFRNRAVLVTGGTKGIGLAIGLAFGQRGASGTLTHKWNSADLQALRARFAESGALEPTIVDADVAHAGDLSAVLMGIRAKQL